MKYEVTFSCGHTGTVQLYGKGDERERKIRYFEEYGVCSECYKERRTVEAEIGCKHVTMSYKAYKTDYSFCDVLNDSYDKRFSLMPEHMKVTCPYRSMICMSKVTAWRI